VLPDHVRMDRMGEDADKADVKRSGWGSAGWIAVALLILYPLSVGPVAFLAGAGVISDASIAALQPAYTPLVTVVDFAPPAERLLLQFYRQPYLLGLRLRR
jgi:pimeloyl-ACP methyl ester carboxylesterase